MAGRSKAKSRDDITSVMHVVYCGEDAVPLQKDTELYVKELQDMPMQLNIIHSWWSCSLDMQYECTRHLGQKVS